VTLPVATVAEPVELHAEGLQVAHRRGVLWLAAQQTDARQPQTPGRRRQGMQMVGMRTAQTGQAARALLAGALQMAGKLEGLVTVDLGVDQVQTQHGQLDAGVSQPIAAEPLQGSGRQVE